MNFFCFLEKNFFPAWSQVLKLFGDKLLESLDLLDFFQILVGLTQIALLYRVSELDKTAQIKFFRTEPDFPVSPSWNYEIFGY